METPLESAKKAIEDYFKLGFASKDLIENVAKEFGVDPAELKEEFVKIIRKPRV